MRREGLTSRAHAAQPRAGTGPQPGSNGASHSGQDAGPVVITGGAGFIYVSDTRQFSASTGWAARIGVREGITRLYDWFKECPPVSLRAQGLTGASPRARMKSLRVRRVRAPAAPRPVRITRSHNLRRVAASAGHNGDKPA